MRRDLHINILDYLIVAIIIVISGAVIYQHYNKLFLIFSFIFFSVVYFFRNKELKINKRNTILVFLMILLIFINCNINISSGQIYKYISYIIRLIMPIIIINILEFENFEKKYCELVYWLSLSSLILYFIIRINPDFVDKFSIIQDFAGSKFSNAYIYAYRLPMINSYRNNSIFWEAGAFQAIVNLALFFNLHISKPSSKIKTIIYILTLITTGSTTGYILMILNVGVYMVNRRRWIGIKYIIITGAITLFLLSGLDDIIVNKFDKENVSFNRRSADFVVDLSITGSSLKNLIIGTGPVEYLNEFPEYIYRLYGMEGTSSSSGITFTIAQFGIIFILILMHYYFRGIKYIFKSNIYTMIIILSFCIVFSTENYIFSPLFLLVAAYKNSYNRALRLNENSEIK